MSSEMTGVCVCMWGVTACLVCVRDREACVGLCLSSRRVKRNI